MISSSSHSKQFEKWTSRKKTNSLRETLRTHARFACLYLRSRLGGYSIVGLTVTVFVGWLSARQIALPSYEIPGKVVAEILMIAALVMPLVAACAIGLSIRSPFGEEEVVASRSLSAVRFYHLTGLLIYAFLLLSLTSLTWELDHAGWILVRNLAGLTGLTLLTARGLGGSLSWILPFAYGALTVTVNVLNDDPPEGWWTRWAWWPLQPATDFPVMMIAIALLTIGISSVCWYRAHL